MLKLTWIRETIIIYTNTYREKVLTIIENYIPFYFSFNTSFLCKLPSFFFPFFSKANMVFEKRVNLSLGFQITKYIKKREISLPLSYTTK